MKPIAIIGAGGLGKEIRALVERTNDFAGFFDDRKDIKENYLGTVDEIGDKTLFDFLLALGSPRLKQSIANRFREKEVTYANVVSNNAVVSAQFLKGKGTIVCDGVVATVDCSFGSHILLNLNVTVGHDVLIGDYCSIMPGANISGGVTIGETTLIGSGAVILQGITIGSNVVVGAGAVVTKDIPDNTTVIGIPARAMRNRIR